MIYSDMASIESQKTKKKVEFDELGMHQQGNIFVSTLVGLLVLNMTPNICRKVINAFDIHFNLGQYLVKLDKERNGLPAIPAWS